MHVAVAHAARREAIEVGRGDGAAVAAELAEAGVVEHDEEDVGCALASSLWLRPSLLRGVEGAADDAWERRAGLVFLETHGFLLDDCQA